MGTHKKKELTAIECALTETFEFYVSRIPITKFSICTFKI